MMLTALGEQVAARLSRGAPLIARPDATVAREANKEIEMVWSFILSTA